MSEEYYPESHEKIYPELEEQKLFVEADLSRKGKTAMIESVDNPASVFYSQFHYYSSSQHVLASFHNIPSGNYILTVFGEDKREHVTVFPGNYNQHQWW